MADIKHQHPLVLQINVCFWLAALRRRYKKKLSLAAIPASEWQSIRAQGYDAVWLMGVWQRSPTAQRMALADPGLRNAYDHVLPDWRPQDVGGSAYAIYTYELDDWLGSAAELCAARQAMNRVGLRLIVDFVPNHTALDHPWTINRRECFISVSEETARRWPGLFYHTPDGHWLAHGKDPHFLPWNDTAQVNFFSPDLRQCWTEQLLTIAAQSDGVRCDMAMLAINELFVQTWGAFVGSAPQLEFWPQVIAATKKLFPDFWFIAEVYWDREWQLQQMGFDFTYDKKLYDRLRYDAAPRVRDHARADYEYQRRCVHFIENHDEERAVAVFGREKSCAAAALAATLPGMRLFQQGQEQGARLHAPVHLRRGPSCRPEPVIVEFYQALLAFCGDPVVQRGAWTEPRLCADAAPEGNAVQVIVYWWRRGAQLRVVVVNYGDRPARPVILLPVLNTVLEDVLTGVPHLPHEQTADHSVVTPGLEPWQVMLWRGRVGK